MGWGSVLPAKYIQASDGSVKEDRIPPVVSFLNVAWPLPMT